MFLTEILSPDYRSRSAEQPDSRSAPGLVQDVPGLPDVSGQDAQGDPVLRTQADSA